MKDLIILGNGMAGMTAALYAKRANLDFKIVGRDEYDFGQISNAILVENFPCVPPQPGMDLAMGLHEQLSNMGVEIEEHEVKKVLKESDGTYSIEYEDETFDYAKTIIYALGARHRQLNCIIEDGIPIHYCALCDGNLYAGKHVAIIGGGDVAFTQAEYLSKICENVTIVMCDENVTAAPSTFDRVSKISNIKIIYNYPVEAIDSYSNRWSLLNNKNSIIVDGIFVAIGMIPNTEPIKYTKILTTSTGYIATDNTLESVNTSGFFAVGDARVKSVRQAITAASDGAIAVQSVICYLRSGGV